MINKKRNRPRNTIFKKYSFPRDYSFSLLGDVRKWYSIHAGNKLDDCRCDELEEIFKKHEL